MLEDEWIPYHDKYFDDTSENMQYILHRLSLEYNPMQGKIRCTNIGEPYNKRNYTLGNVKDIAAGWQDLYEFILADQNKNIELGEN